MAGSWRTVSSTRQTPSPGSAAPAGDGSLFGMIGWKPCTFLYLAWAPPGAAREKPGLPPTLGGW